MEATGCRPQLLLRTESDVGYNRVMITKSELGLDMEVCPRHEWFKHIETGGVVHGTPPGVPITENNGSSNLASPEGPNRSHDASPNADTEHFPPNQLPAKLHDSIGAIQCLERGIKNPNVELTPLEEFHEILGFLESGDTIHHMFDALLVWLYRLELLQYLQRLLLRFKKTDNNLLFETAVFLLLEVKSSALEPPQWLLVILGRSERNGRWLNELSLQWIDTTWRTAFSVLHVGSISPVASLPRVNPARLKALWAAVDTRLPTPTSPAPDPPLIHTSVPCRACGNGQKRATPSSATVAGSGPGKRRKQRQGNGRGNKVVDDPDEGSFNREKGPGEEAKAKSDDTAARHFACHYYKRYPLAYAGCLNHHQIFPRYVKRHLLRSHRQPIHCPTCYQEFEARAACNQHIVTRNCEARGSNPWSDRISEDAERDLDALPRGDGATKWFEMWDALFPGVPRPSSPYVDPRNYESAIMVSVGEHTAPAFRDRLGRRFTGEPELVGEIMEVYAQTFGTESPSASAASSGTGPDQALPSDPRLVVPPAGVQSSSPVLPTDEDQFDSVWPDFLLQFQRQQQEEERGRRQMQQYQFEQMQRQLRPQGPFQGGVTTPTVTVRPPQSSASRSNAHFTTQQAMANPTPTHTHGNSAHDSLSRPLVQSADNLHPSQTNTDSTQQQTFGSRAHSFNQQHPDLAQAFGVHENFFHNGVQENSQFPGSDAQQANQNMVHDNNPSRFVNPRDLQLNRSAGAARTSESSQPSAGSAQPAPAPTGQSSYWI